VISYSNTYPKAHLLQGIKRVFFNTAMHLAHRKFFCIKEAVAQKFHDFKLGERNFGPSWSTHWFHVSIVVPKALDKHQVVLQWDMGCEGMVWSADGVPLQGLTGGCMYKHFIDIYIYIYIYIYNIYNFYFLF
jgi:alpha-mannosidase